jgi:hypothetical protein
MIVRQTALAAAALIAATAPAYAGPCTGRIYEANLAISKVLNSAAARAGTARQTAFATMHRQPTPSSIATAEQQEGVLTDEETQAITEDMDEARRADGEGDLDRCQKALDDVDGMLRR